MDRQADLQRLEDLFARGALVRPSDREPNLVHLVRAVATLGGVPDLDGAAAVRELIPLVGPADHLVFVLLDGLGMNIVRRLPADSFLASTLRRELNATCPSTTACALTSVATAQYPNRTAVAGWFTHLPEFGLTATTLPFTERFGHRPLTEHGLKVEDVLPVPAFHTRLSTHRPMTLVPAYIAHTTYNLYSRGGTPGRGFVSTADAVDQVVGHVAASASAGERTYTHVYLHDVDTACHHAGACHDDVLSLVGRIDAELRRMAEGLAAGAGQGKARVVVSADHGLIDVPQSDQTLLHGGDPLLEMLTVPCTGDARMPVFHVREGRGEAFAGAFRERFGDRMVLVATDDAERLELFGPGRMTPTARGRFGDYIALPFRPATLAFHPSDKPVGRLFAAVHAGLSPEEMRVPMCVA